MDPIDTAAPTGLRTSVQQVLRAHGCCDTAQQRHVELLNFSQHLRTTAVGAPQVLCAFGVELRADFPLPAIRSAPGGRPVRARLAEDAALDSAWDAGTATEVWRTRFGDGTAVTAAQDAAGAYLLHYGDAARYVLSPGADELLVHATDPGDPVWMRFLLDTVLWWIALVHGRHLLHASVISTGEETVALLGGQGAGKTTLAAAMMARGCALFSDDLLCLQQGGVAFPGPPLMNLPEALAADALGTEIARFTEPEPEAWVVASRSVAERRTPTHLVFLDRSGDGPVDLQETPITPLQLLPHAWGLPHDRAAARPRFEALADLAATARGYHLHAGCGVEAAELAATLSQLLGSTAVHGDD